MLSILLSSSPLLPTDIKKPFPYLLNLHYLIAALTLYEDLIQRKAAFVFLNLPQKKVNILQKNHEFFDICLYLKIIYKWTHVISNKTLYIKIKSPK